jgi:two-component system cell cycle sensor histidine kinase/response regulator CckA
MGDDSNTLGTEGGKMNDGKTFSSTMRIEIPPDLLAEVSPKGPETARLRARVKSPETKRFAGPTGSAEDKYNQLLQSIYDAAIITKTSGQIVDCNSRASEFFYFARDEFIRLNILNLVSGADPKLLQTLYQNLQNEKFALIQAYCVRKDGSYFPAEIAVNPLKFEQFYFCFFVRDITVRRKAEEMLRTEHNAIQNAGNGIAIADVRGRLEYVNPAFVKMWGFQNAEEAAGLPAADLFSDAQEVLQTVMRTGESWTGELTAKRRNGETFSAQVAAACNRDSDGEIVGMVLSFVDITDRKRAEEALRQAERQRAMLASVGAACHHLGQPATVIMTNLELIRRMTKDMDRKELQEILDLTNEAADTLAEVLHKLNAVTEYRTVQYLDTKDGQLPTNIILDI